MARGGPQGPWWLESGQLPPAARARLAAASRAGAPFSSALPAAGAALLRRAGLDPLCLVAGSAVIAVRRIAVSAWNEDGLAVELTVAHQQAARLAQERLVAEARAVGAHGVVGVRTELEPPRPGLPAVTARLLGTAVREAGAPAAGQPWLCGLALPDWWALARAGYLAAGLVSGCCAWAVPNTAADRDIVRQGVAAEFSHFGTALRHCRMRVMEQLAQQAAACGAAGTVGVQVRRSVQEVTVRHRHPARRGIAEPGEGDEVEEPRPGRWNDHLLVLSALGTAVRPAPAAGAAITPLLPLRPDRRP